MSQKRSPRVPPAIVLARSPSSRLKISWSPEMVALLGTMPDLRVARQLGLYLLTVRNERRRRKIPPFCWHRPRVEWTEEMTALLGVDTDSNVGAELGLPRHCVRWRRLKLGIPTFQPPNRRRWDNAYPWTPEEDALLATMPDSGVAEALGITTQVVAYRRLKLRVAPFTPVAPPIRWSPEMLEMLGHTPDEHIAERFGISRGSVRDKRHELDVAAFRQDVKPIARTAQLAELLQAPDRELRRSTGIQTESLHRLRAEYGIEAPAPDALRWSAEKLVLLGTRPDVEIAQELGLGEWQVWHKRKSLGIAPYRAAGRVWSAEEIALLGKAPDPEVARQLGRSLASVRSMRQQAGIPRFVERPWRAEEIALLGTANDREIAERLGRGAPGVYSKRRSLGIPACPQPRTPAEEIALLGTMSDYELARRTGKSDSWFQKKRKELGIPPFRAAMRPVVLTPELESVLRASDREVKNLTGMDLRTIRRLRAELGIEEGVPGARSVRGVEGRSALERPDFATDSHLDSRSPDARGRSRHSP